MILYDPRQKSSFQDFGIEIPIEDSKTIKTFQQLTSHPRLGACIDRWHLGDIDEVIAREDLLRVHAPAYIERLFSDQLETEIVRTYELVDAQGRFHRYNPAHAVQPLSVLFTRILQRVAGSLQCCRTALRTGFCFYFGGGMHHAQYGYGNGFCLVNDIVIALRRLQSEACIRTAWVIDVDAHKGDGTAALTQGDDSIRTLSIHMARGWPLDGAATDASGAPNPSFIPSDIDIPVEAGDEDRYNDLLQEGLARLAQFPPPDLALVVSGVDPYEKDALPSTQPLQLTRAHLQARDRLVYRFLQQRRIPHAALMAGGYGPNAWEIYSDFLLWAMLDRLNLSS
jgi:acetoin utilization deacetylase AcuC-like enzyme